MPSRKLLLLHAKARVPLAKGFSRALEVVSATFGPKGRVVLLENPVGDPFGVTPPEIVRRGYLLLEEAEVGSLAERVGLHLVREVAREVWQAHGDGSKQAALVAARLANGVLRLREAGFNPSELETHLRQAGEQALAALKAKRVWLEEGALQRVAAMTLGPNEAPLLLEGLTRSPLGEVEVEAREGQEGLELEVVEGIAWPFPPLDRWLGAEERSYLLALFQDPLEDPEELAPMLAWAADQGQALLVVAPAYGEGVKQLLHLNRHRLPLAAYLAPQASEWRRERLEDLAVATGSPLHIRGEAQCPSPETLKLVWAKPEDEGIRLEPRGGRASERVRHLLRRLEEAEGFERERLMERIRHLSPRVRLWVGSPTLATARYRRERIRESLALVTALRQGGAVPGAGAALAQVAEGLREPDGIGRELKEALLTPYRQLLANAGLAQKHLNPSQGPVDVFTGRPAPLWDPYPVVDLILRKALSLGILLARTEGLLVEEALEYELPIDSAGPIKEAGIE
jgi:chaperonin GroEL